MSGEWVVVGAVEHVETLRDHWWWRPGWREGRHFYACHFTFENQRQVRELVSEYQSVLRPMEGLDPIPAEWLHMTMQGVGFVDEIAPEERKQLLKALATRLAMVPPPVVTFHRPVVRPEAVYLPAEPMEPIHTVRAAVRESIAEVLGDGALDEAADYRPHVSVAYSNTTQDAGPIVSSLTGLRTSAVVAEFPTVRFLEFHRDRRMYEWTVSEPLRIG
jgi:2'-5' RNA ligase